jgi:fimbrial chaperone protein
MRWQQVYGASVAVVVTAWACIPVQASSLHVAPVSLRLEPGQLAAGLTLSNPSSQPLVAQVRVLAWGQTLDDDPLSTQQDVVASPPIATIAPHAEQFVRVVRLDKAAPTHELTYRLLVDELPDPSQASGLGAVDIRIRYSVPLFVIPARGTAPRVTWDVTQHGAAYFVRATNAGGLHAQISALKIVGAGDTDTNLVEGLLGYVLAGSSREWQLPEHTPVSSAGMHLRAAVNGSQVEFNAPVVPTLVSQ